MGIRSKQLDMDDLYSVLDTRYSTIDNAEAKSFKVELPTEGWELEDTYYTMTKADLESIHEDSKLIMQASYDITLSEEANLSNSDLFYNIVKAVPGEGTIKFYSKVELPETCNIIVMIV